MQVDIKNVLKERFGDFARSHLQIRDNPFDDYVHILFKLPVKSLGNAIRVRLFVKKSHHYFIMADRYDLYRKLRREFGERNVDRAIRIARKLFPMTSELTSFCDEHKVTETAFTVDELVYNAVDYFTMAVIIWTLTKGNSFFGFTGVGRTRPLGPNQAMSRIHKTPHQHVKAEAHKSHSEVPSLDPSLDETSAVSSSSEHVSGNLLSEMDLSSGVKTGSKSSKSTNSKASSSSSVHHGFSREIKSIIHKEVGPSEDSASEQSEGSNASQSSVVDNESVSSSESSSDEQSSLSVDNSSESSKSSEASASVADSSSVSSSEDPLAKYRVPYHHSLSTSHSSSSADDNGDDDVNIDNVIRSHQDSGHYDGSYTISRPSKLVSEALNYLKNKTGKAIRVQDLQDHFHLSYDRARHLMHQLTARQAVSEPVNKKSRKVIL